ncbi:MAG TPA: WYL domain-containing protein [Solirubrobacteraceae bacterium]|nr:WYL domain-containing protein [Solirubrobacteraceae bacterium]
MAERRPVTATEIRRDVEGYSDMTEDAFARRFYADRAELDALGIHLSVDKPADGFSEQENYSLAPEAFHLPAIAFTDAERAALQTALTLLGGEFAYAEPLRLALQQITWGRPSPLGSDLRQTIGLGITASAGGAELSARLAKIDTAIYRRKRIEFEYYTMQTGATALRKVDPYHLLFEGGQFYLVGHSHERSDVRVFKLSRIRGKVAYATKAEHDFQRPADFDPRKYAGRTPWQLGDTIDTAEVWVSDDVSWYVERQFGAYGELRDNVFQTAYAIPRLLISWALGLRQHARIDGPPALVEEARERLDRIVELHRGDPPAVGAAPPPPAPEPEANGRARGETAGTIRPERFARLVTLASVLIAAGRAGRRLPVDEVCDQLKMSPQELREDISVLNVVNFGGGAYVIYAEVLPTGEIEVDPEPYSDTFDRPARLLPIEAKALVAAIDLLNLAQPELGSAREKVVAALGHDPVEEGLQITSPTVADEVAHTVERAVHEGRVLEIEYWDEQKFTERQVEPYALLNGRDGWYVAAVEDRLKHFRLDRIKRAVALDERFEARPDLNPIADVGGWPRTGEIEGSQAALVWISAEQARWAREKRTVVAEHADGSIVVEVRFKGVGWLVKEILKEAGDAAVLEPPDAREAVLAAAQKLHALVT